MVALEKDSGRNIEIPRFNGEYFGAWKTQVLEILGSDKDLVIEGKDKKIQQETQKETEDFINDEESMKTYVKTSEGRLEVNKIRMRVKG